MNSPFNLDISIAAWRRRYEHDRSFLPEDIRELEQHVRDQIAALVSQGASKEEAFLHVMREMGEHEEVRAAYRDVRWGKIKREHTVTHHLSTEIAMLKNYLMVALRNLRRHPGYSFINVAGLSVGIACCLLILLFVRDEMSYDRFHEKADRIFRVTMGAAGQELAVTPTIVAPLFKREFPEVEEAARLYDVGSWRPVVVRYGENAFLENRFSYADSTLFDVFTLPLLLGNPERALTRPNTIVISQSMAHKYYGSDDPLGKSLTIGPEREFEVTGVMADLPYNSHVQFDFLASFSTLGWSNEEIWSSANFFTYVLLREDQPTRLVQQKISVLLDRVRDQQSGTLSSDYRLTLQPLTRIHLSSEGRITYVYLFSAIAFFILLIACVNYLNLATARSARRAREVGVRKVLGAYRGQLSLQFFAESALLTLTALVAAVALAWLSLPLFNSISGKQLTFTPFEQPATLFSLLGMGLLVTLLAGSYPALMLSSFHPANVLKSGAKVNEGSLNIRRGLVIFQFAVSIFLVSATCVVYYQLEFVRSQNLGFGQEQVVVLPLTDFELRQQYTSLKDALLQHPQVLHASAVNSTPGYQRGGYALIAEGLQLPEGEYFPVRGVPADKDIAETLGLNLIAGPGLLKSDGYTPQNGNYMYLVNEATARRVGWSPEEAIGKKMGLSESRMGEVVGVVQDYHYASLHEPVEPLALFIEEPESFEYLTVKIAPENIPGTLGFLQQVWSERAPGRPFHYTFLDQEFDALYRADERAGQIFGGFAGLAILIGCMGLFGLSAFSAAQRTKEIGVRKVLGASISSIVMLLSREFVLLVLVGLAVAAPVTYTVMNRWLEAFAYRIDISWWIFALSGVLALLIALATVSYQAVKAALADPVKSLRYE